MSDRVTLQPREEDGEGLVVVGPEGTATLRELIQRKHEAAERLGTRPG